MNISYVLGNDSVGERIITKTRKGSRSQSADTNIQMYESTNTGTETKYGFPKYNRGESGKGEQRGRVAAGTRQRGLLLKG